MSIIGSNILAGSAGQGGGYTIERSVRLRSSASAYFNRTLGSSGSLRAWTWSAWIKRGALSSSQVLFGWVDLNAGNFQHVVQFKSDNTLDFYMYNSIIGGYPSRKNTAQLFRDPSAWYHVVCTWDSNNATAEERARVYVNGTRVTAWANNTTPALNLDSYINNSIYPLGLGVGRPSGSDYFDGYLTEVNFIDGQALDPSDFGEYNADTGVWQPVAYAGTYGTNGFYLPFSDATTTTTLAADASGNGNDWTPNNISLTAGATYDSMTDTPTPYAGGGNYPTWNPNCKGSDVSLANGNLDASWVNVNGHSVYATMGFPTTGKWYCEMTGAYQVSFGLVPTSSFFVTTQVGYPNAGIGYRGTDGQKVINAVFSAYGATYTTTDIVAVVYDADNLTLRFYKNNVDQGAITVAADSYTLAVGFQTTTPGIAKINFGQRPFAYTPPTGFLPLHTGNLPDSAIVDGSEYFEATTYTGDGATTKTISGLNFQTDFAWVKRRSAAGSHVLQDAVRTFAGSTKLSSNSTNAEGAAGATAEAEGYVSAVSSTGFTVTKGTGEQVNENGATYVAWNWKAGTAFSNDAGTNGATIASVGSVNQDAGFSIVTYTGNSTSGATVAHSLGAEPKMVIVKARGTPNGIARSWFVYHGELGGTKFIYLDQALRDQTGSTVWNNTNPSSTVFTLGNENSVNQSTYDYVAYCFADVEGYSKFGSYTANNSSDGVFVYLGFKPKFVLHKRSDSSGDWYIWDSEREPNNYKRLAIWPNYSNPENDYAGTQVWDFVSNGMKARTNSAINNTGSANYIYMAFAENPFKNSLAG